MDHAPVLQAVRLTSAPPAALEASRAVELQPATPQGKRTAFHAGEVQYSTSKVFGIKLSINYINETMQLLPVPISIVRLLAFHLQWDRWILCVFHEIESY